MVGPAEQVVTGDAVVLDVQIAQLPVRALSSIPRPEATAAFPAGTVIPELSMPGPDYVPSVTEDGLDMIYVRGAPTQQIWETTRARTTSSSRSSPRRTPSR